MKENRKKETQPSLDGANKADSTRSDGAKTKIIPLRPDEKLTHVKNITKKPWELYEDQSQRIQKVGDERPTKGHRQRR